MAAESEQPVAFEAVAAAVVPGAPRLSGAQAPLLQQIEVIDDTGVARGLRIPAEAPLTVYVDRRELVTLMTLGAAPELMVLGWLLNQGLVDRVQDIEAIDVDWSVHAAAVKTRRGIARWAERTARRVVTTGCGQGTVFGDQMAQIDAVRLPAPGEARIRRETLAAMIDAMRSRYDVHRAAGSVHGCALFRDTRMMVFVEDVGRHNAIDAVAGWMAMHGVGGGDKAFYTTGRLTSEMVIKSARMGVPIIVSRNGVTAMGHDLASRLGMALFGRAAARKFICYCGFERWVPDAGPPDAETADPSVDRASSG
ncbi:MAG TPA: formate dehydrogenase accessory sulfurtransferase FdhD [Burkholderiaceae bacterium]|nr:formate dehydrogenase accessory sulfurtransferase FdhD [Burkholderiaceae bacterium]